MRSKKRLMKANDIDKSWADCLMVSGDEDERGRLILNDKGDGWLEDMYHAETHRGRGEYWDYKDMQRSDFLENFHQSHGGVGLPSDEDEVA